MKSHVFRVHAATNMLTGPSGSVTLRHHQAGRFLAALVLAVPRAEGLSRAAFLADWHTAPGTLGPDRTAISRVVKAVQNGLSQAGSASRVVSAPRKTTVGPWRMYAPATEDWRVDSDALRVLGSRSNPLQPNLCIAAQSTPEDMLPAMTAVVIADALAQQALYTEAVQHINEHEPGLRLSSEGRALLLLRTVRWLRRLGRRADAEGALVAARAHARAAHPQARANLLAECAVQTARITYDKAPLRLASRINFNTLSDQIELAGSAQLSWECANLRALASRRKLQALLARAPQARSADVATIADDALRSFRAAFFWLLVNFDAYHLQAVLVNYAYHLQWLMHETTPLLQAPNIADVVGAWHLSQTIVEKFDLPEDSAWDYIMLSDLWFGQPAARASIRTDWRLWLKQRSPANLDFYLRGVELAKGSGDSRQQLLALDRCAAFLTEIGLAQKAEAFLRERDQILGSSPDLVGQLAGERLWGAAPGLKR